MTRIGRCRSTLWLPLALLTAIVLLGACRREKLPPEPQRTPEVVAATLVPSPTSTPTATPSPTASATPSPTATNTPTPTATPTLAPVAVIDARRGAPRRTPESQSNTPCGVVDLFDFPLDPPDGVRAALGQDFGRGRQTTRQHAGEDWGMLGRPNLGAPVYSIGHGRVTYAQPLGWGRDKGVVIIEHVLADGSTLLSFYGHLHPPSVVLSPGQCVARGDLVGTIGAPRSPPHLHFEIRTHMLSEPGPGYWPAPASAGWKHPSQVIWDSRIAAMPGVLWTRPLSNQFLRVLGLLDAGVVVIVQQQALVAVDGQDGSERWRLAMPDGIIDGLLSSDASILYLLGAGGQLAAYDLAGDTDVGAPPLRWQHQLDLEGTAVLTPLPGGGVVASDWHMRFATEQRLLYGQRQVTGVSRDGDVLWEEDISTSSQWLPGDDRWALVGDQLVLATMDEEFPFWVMDEGGVTAGPLQVSGRPVSAGEEIWFLERNGVYTLDPVTLSVQAVTSLPEAYLRRGEMLVLPDGSLLLAVDNGRERRLSLLDQDGALQWERSYDSLASGDPYLMLLDGRPYLLLQHATSASVWINLYAVDVDQPAVRHLFAAGGPARGSAPASIWSLGAGRLLISIDRGSMAVLEQAGTE